ncbi:MAG: bifunctional hydroxymethylpyrimidine kinase/phosphomethylpyrimidine kinase, partial [Desulfovibrio sp.]|nr:bifunctional hydroxymethylpyrimidine kinase/phosphomethylpyrimidine kinase [Desulfovibrio sp.]
MQTHPVILTIAGSDSGGGAGIQADLKTIMALCGYGVSAITALTAQNGLQVDGIQATPAEFVLQQLQTIAQGFPIACAKTGMLFRSDIISTVAHWLQTQSFPVIVDPVCASQSGFRLMEDEAIETLRNNLLPVATLLTPNVP